MEPSVLTQLQAFMSEFSIEPGRHQAEILHLNLSITLSRYLTLNIRTACARKYVIMVPTYITHTFSITECDAVIDALTIATPGTHLTDDTFDHFIRSLRDKYRRVSEPISSGQARIAAIFASVRPERPCHAEHRIILAELLLVENNLIQIFARTAAGNIYIVTLHPSYENYGLCAANCRFLKYALLLLRRGTVIPPEAFLAETMFFRETCQFHDFEIGENPTSYNISFKVTSDGSQISLPARIEQAAKDTICKMCPWFMPPHHVRGLFQSPHPLICFGKILREDPCGHIFFALRRRVPCAIRVFADDVDITTFLAETVKQLLLFETHPNLVGVHDVFTEPRAAILLDDMFGPQLSEVVTQAGGLSDSQALRFATQIARGISFLHSRAFVHHELGLFNIYVCEGECRIACLEFGMLDPLTSFTVRDEVPVSPDPEIQILQGDGVASIHQRIAQDSLGAIPGVRLTLVSGGENVLTTHSRAVPTRSLADRLDVLLFGTMLWEMLTGSQLLFNDNTKQSENRMADIVLGKKDELMLKLDGRSDGLKSVINSCWCSSPSQRPRMSVVLDDLEKLEDQLPMSRTSQQENIEGNTDPETIPEHLERNGARQFVDAGPGFGEERGPHNIRERQPCYIPDRFGNMIDAFANYERRYPESSGSRNISTETASFLNWRDCFVLMNALEAMSISSTFKNPAYWAVTPGMNHMRRREAQAVLGDNVMAQLDMGFSSPVSSSCVQDIFDALTAPYRGVCKGVDGPIGENESRHLRLALSYRHVHPDYRKEQGWPPRQRIAETSYKTIAKRVSAYAQSVNASIVSIWTDQHFAGSQKTDGWGNNCLLPYAIYPVFYFEGGDENEDRLWICAEHQLALSGEGIISEVDELRGVWRKTKHGAVAGKLLPLSRGISEAATNLLQGIHLKETYHPSDRDDIIAWTKAIAFFGFYKDIWKDYKTLSRKNIASEVISRVLVQGFSPIWVNVCEARRWENGAVLRTSNGLQKRVKHGERGWHGLWDWVNIDVPPDASEILATVHVEQMTRATEIEANDGRKYAFVYLVGKLGQICRCSIVYLRSERGQTHVTSVRVLDEYMFTVLLKSLKAISCMKEVHDTEEDTAEFLSMCNQQTMAHGYPFERTGQPPVSEVNEVLNALQEQPVSTIRQYRFSDGHELEWH
eukprot:GFKZ01002763.1.p1 GENE.GFKZ01002763.1~~GFKZ01002763.1.p1  ORF type:complete len:1185 (+),score=130.99 GFKZ01002763.1:72-3557(+)